MLPDRKPLISALLIFAREIEGHRASERSTGMGPPWLPDRSSAGRVVWRFVFGRPDCHPNGKRGLHFRW
jgi:hypothetical protein